MSNQQNGQGLLGGRGNYFRGGYQSVYDSTAAPVSPALSPSAQNYQAQQRHKAAVEGHVAAATIGWLQREASYTLTEPELAEKVWDMAELLATEGEKRGYY